MITMLYFCPVLQTMFCYDGEAINDAFVEMPNSTRVGNHVVAIGKLHSLEELVASTMQLHLFLLTHLPTLGSNALLYIL